MLDNFFNASFQLATLKKEDGNVPEAQAVIDVMTPLMAGWWRDNTDAAVERIIGVLALSEHDGRSKALRGNHKHKDRWIKEMVLALLVVLEQSMATLPKTYLYLGIREAAGRLFRDGANLVGHTYDAHDDAFVGMQERAARSLEMLLRGRVVTQRAQIIVALEEFLRSGEPAARTPFGLRPGPQGFSFESKLREILNPTAKHAAWIRGSVDVWAYLWLSLGGYLQARQNGEREFVYWNPLDQKTSKFCRWVAGKPAYMVVIDSAIKRLSAATDTDDVERLIGSWPLFSASSAERTDYSEVLKALGIPPFHPYCRTRIVPARWVRAL